MTVLQDILRIKGNSVYTINPEATLEDVVQRLVEHNCGSLVVCAGNHCADVLGIVTERDILRATAARQGSLSDIRVGEVMSMDLITGSPTDSIEHVMGQMTTHRVRHLPILENGSLCGIISIGDVVKSQLDNLAMENHYLKNYINGDTTISVDAVSHQVH